MIKIDQSFVRNMLKEQNDFDIVESVVRLTQAFKRPVIAEGVETVAHGLRLLNMGCHLTQGYGIAKPMPADALPNWIAHWQKTAPWKQWLLASKTQTA
jgi:EAL domain-containing protein (putative c-di-GMP-specific phosphodiesterase class I)